MLALLQVVRVLRDLPDKGIVRGTLGTVVFVFDSPQRAYEIEFADADGRTVAMATLDEQSLEAVAPPTP